MAKERELLTFQKHKENTYGSYIQEDIINEYEASGEYKNTSIEEYTESLSNYYANALGRQVNIQPDNGYDNNTNWEIGKLGSQEKTGRRIEFDITDEQDGTRDTSKNGNSNQEIPIAPIKETSSEDGVFFDEKTQFSVSDIDAEYMQAVENGDMETAQILVKEASEKAGYTTDLTAFDKGNMESSLLKAKR